MGIFAYNVLLWTACVLGAPLWLALALCRAKWRAGLRERLGLVPARLQPPAAGPEVAWVHAVSVGEVLAAKSLIARLEREYQVYISTTTRAGQELARRLFGAERVFYFPLDLQFAIAAYVRKLRPRLVVLLETEFWPNFVRSVSRYAQVTVVNARISDRSLPGYKRFSWIFRPVLESITLFAAQTEEDARRLIAIGAARERVQCGGNLKFDWQATGEPALAGLMRRAVAQAGVGMVVVAGSTVDEEEALVLGAFRELQSVHPQSLLVMAPRHPERFDEVAALLVAEGFAYIRRSQWSGDSIEGQEVFLLDTIGELASLYQLADIAFVGGSLVPRGGHNILEPAYYGKAIVVGKHTENFRDIIATFLKADALSVCAAQDLGGRWIELANDPRRREQLGENAQAVMRAHGGATQRTMAVLTSLMRSSR